MKRYLVYILVFFLALSVIIGCSKEDDGGRSLSAEQADADLMATGLASLTGDLGTYDDYVGVSSASRDPPPGWCREEDPAPSAAERGASPRGPSRAVPEDPCRSRARDVPAGARGRPRDLRSASSWRCRLSR